MTKHWINLKKKFFLGIQDRALQNILIRTPPNERPKQ